MLNKVKIAVFYYNYGDFVFLPARVWSIRIRLGTRADKFYLTFSTSASLSKKWLKPHDINRESIIGMKMKCIIL